MVTMVIKLCFDVADAASVVVCNSSPEGYIPEETDHGKSDEGHAPPLPSPPPPSSSR